MSQSEPRWVLVSLSPRPVTLIITPTGPVTPAWVTSPCTDRSSSSPPTRLSGPDPQDCRSSHRHAILSYAKLTSLEDYPVMQLWFGEGIRVSRPCLHPLSFWSSRIVSNGFNSLTRVRSGCTDSSVAGLLLVAWFLFKGLVSCLAHKYTHWLTLTNTQTEAWFIEYINQQSYGCTTHLESHLEDICYSSCFH